MTAGYELAKKGHQVVVFESDPEPGGLIGTISSGGQDLERFYHHIFTGDTDLIALIEELGVLERLEWLEPRNGFFTNGTLYPFTTPFDLLRFKELSFWERIALGLLVFKAKSVSDWRFLEKVLAKDWVIKNAGRNVYDKVWGPLLEAKFDDDAEAISAVWLWNKFKLRGSTRDKNLNRELLGYLSGSFGIFIRSLVDKIGQLGGSVRCSTTVERIGCNPDDSLRIMTTAGDMDFERVIVTCAPEKLIGMMPELPATYVAELHKIQYKANICLLLELSEPISPYYWISVADSALPFVAMIEHTNLVRYEPYQSYIVYLSRYLDAQNRLCHASDAAIIAEFCGGVKQIFPHWSEKTIKNATVSRARYAQPVIGTEYSSLKPAIQTPITNLYLACMAQIYPEDRGQSYAVRMGRELARQLQ